MHCNSWTSLTFLSWRLFFLSSSSSDSMSRRALWICEAANYCSSCVNNSWWFGPNSSTGHWGRRSLRRDVLSVSSYLERKSTSFISDVLKHDQPKKYEYYLKEFLPATHTVSESFWIIRSRYCMDFLINPFQNLNQQISTRNTTLVDGIQTHRVTGFNITLVGTPILYNAMTVIRIWVYIFSEELVI